eukprot:769484-Prymnesium_polylepis.1
MRPPGPANTWRSLGEACEASHIPTRPTKASRTRRAALDWWWRRRRERALARCPRGRRWWWLRHR